MRKSLAATAAAVVGLTAAVAADAGNGHPVDTGTGNAVTIAVYGDAPYGTTPVARQGYRGSSVA